MFENSKMNGGKISNIKSNTFKYNDNSFETNNVISLGVQDKNNGYMLYNGNCLMFNLCAFNLRCENKPNMYDNPATVFHCPISVIPKYKSNREGSFGTEENKWKVAGLDNPKYKLNSYTEIYPNIYYYYFKVNTICPNPIATQVYVDLLCLQKACEQILLDIMTTKLNHVQIFDHDYLELFTTKRNIRTKNTGDMFVALEDNKIICVDSGQIASILYRVDQEFRKICCNLPKDFTCILDESHSGIYEYQKTRKLEGYSPLELIKLDFTNIEELYKSKLEKLEDYLKIDLLPIDEFIQMYEYAKYGRFRDYVYNNEFRRLIYNNSLNNIDVCINNLYNRPFENDLLLWTSQGEYTQQK